MCKSSSSESSSDSTPLVQSMVQADDQRCSDTGKCRVDNQFTGEFSDSCSTRNIADERWTTETFVTPPIIEYCHSIVLLNNNCTRMLLVKDGHRCWRVPHTVTRDEHFDITKDTFECGLCLSDSLTRISTSTTSQADTIRVTHLVVATNDRVAEAVHEVPDIDWVCISTIHHTLMNSAHRSKVYRRVSPYLAMVFEYLPSANLLRSNAAELRKRGDKKRGAINFGGDSVQSYSPEDEPSRVRYSRTMTQVMQVYQGSPVAECPEEALQFVLRDPVVPLVTDTHSIHNLAHLLPPCNASSPSPPAVERAPQPLLRQFTAFHFDMDALLKEIDD